MWSRFNIGCSSDSSVFEVSIDVSAGELARSYTQAGYCFDLSSSSGEAATLKPSSRTGCCRYAAAPPSSVAAAAAAATHLLDVEPEGPVTASPPSVEAAGGSTLADAAVRAVRWVSGWCDRKGECPASTGSFWPVGKWRRRILSCIYQLLCL